MTRPSDKTDPTGFLWVEEGQQRHGMVVEVAALTFTDRTYSYAVPEKLENQIALGQRVNVPLGKRGRLTIGFIVDIDHRPWDSTLRPIDSLIDSTTFLTPDLIALGRKISEHYACPLARTLKAMTPEAVRKGSGLKNIRFVRLIRPKAEWERKEEAEAEAELEEKNVAADDKASRFRMTATRRRVLEYLFDHTQFCDSKEPRASARAVTKTQNGRTIAHGHLEARSNKTELSQKTALHQEIAPLQEIALPQLLEAVKVSPSVIKTLAKAGWIEVKQRKAASDEPAEVREAVEPDHILTEDQQKAFTEFNRIIDAKAFHVALLWGVSGSGKTELYVKTIRRVLEAGKQAILLVPEVLLTTQLLERLAPRFPDAALYHSGLTDSQRSIIWRQVAKGEKRVVIGTRSAVFAPCPNLGLICVDEEQEASYKNLQAPRYHVRDVAIMRAKKQGVPVILGSATPAIETWYHSHHRADYSMITLPRRVLDLPMPKVRVVDMVDECREMRKQVTLSRAMVRLLGQTLERGEQTIILVNRRGFAHRLVCLTCRARLSCPHCSSGLVAHAATQVVACHYCHRKVPLPSNCPNIACGQPLTLLGTGTQRIESDLHEQFPTARIVRVDRDTMTHRREYERVIAQFSAREIDILVGTQMIAKGLDFPNVSFVGVVSAEDVVISGEFRSNERFFQLITQVAGRAGRAEATGNVIIQTTMPDVAALRFALDHDYPSFADQELADRRKLGLPPYSRLVRIVLTHPREEVVQREIKALALQITESITTTGMGPSQVVGTAPCFLPRIRDQYRYELLFQCPDAPTLRRLMHHLSSTGQLQSKAKSMTIDVDPVSFT